MKSLARLFFVCFLVFVPLAVLPTLAVADDPIVGEIRMFAGPDTGIPDGWLAANGNCVPISNYPDLTDVISQTFGDCGNPSLFIGLPNFNTRFPVGAVYAGCGINCWDYTLGDTGGEEYHTLTISEMPSHTHNYNWFAMQAPGGWNTGGPWTPLGNLLASTTSGGDEPHNNIPPYLAVNFIIFTGVYLLPTPTPTPAPTPTPDPDVVVPYVYTHTLQSGHLLLVPVQASFGQLIVAGSILALVAVGVFYLKFVVVYRK